MRTALAAAVTVLMVGPIAAAVPASAAVPPTPGGWQLLFSDDFTGAAGTLPSAANWIIDTGTSYPGGPANWGTGEIQTYTNSTTNIRQDGTGNLRITPIRSGTSWTSARIETQRANFTAPAGGVLRIEGRIQMPNVTGAGALGYWPAFWALGSPYRGNWWNWPAIGEFDIMENVNGLDSVWGVLHCGVNPGGPCNETSGIAGNRACPGSSCQSGFHTYRFEWDRGVVPNMLRWYVDGIQFHSVSQTQVGSAWPAMTEHAGYFLLLNVAMGGAFPDALGGPTPTPSTVSGVPMLVDYVAVWQTTGTTPPATCDPVLSRGRPAVASSVEAGNLTAPMAVDGNPGTRWSSAFSDPQWIRVDLGSPRSIGRVRLNWEAAFARAYAIETSADGVTWTPRFSTSTGDGGIDDIAVSATARYVRMLGSQRGTPYGYSLWEFDVCGGAGGGGGVSAYSTIQAESFQAQQGVAIESTSDTGGGQNLAALANGDWARYDNVDFGSTPPVRFEARVASGAAGGISGLVQVRLDSPTGPVLGEFAVANTGGWQSWRTVPGNVGGVTGTHTVYLTLSSGQSAEFVNVNWFTFAAG